MQDDNNIFNFAKKFSSDIFNAMPGIDEAMAYYEIWKLVCTSEYDTVIFDTAPTGHTLRLLNFPSFLEESLSKMKGLKDKMGGMVNAMSMMAPDMGLNADELMGKFDEYLPVVKQIKEEFRDPDKTTFIGVCIAEFLSLYETERLIQQLMKLEIDCQSIIINQLLMSEDQTQTI